MAPFNTTAPHNKTKVNKHMSRLLSKHLPFLNISRRTAEDKTQGSRSVRRHAKYYQFSFFFRLDENQRKWDL